MAQDQSNSSSSIRRRTQVGETEGEEVQMSLMDALDEADRLEADADAVLGGSDAYNCTYPQGYLQRQAIYACATCTPEGNAGICLACSYACHEGHDVYELYTKRNFKCDCGNQKFKGNPCQIFKDKKELNSRNRYNQNFRGLYCSCSRPYPDEEDTIEDEMIQCIICEDWYHGRHLKTEVPDNSDYHEMICVDCMSRYSFLWAYHVNCALVTKVEPDIVRGEVEVEVNTEESPSGSSNSETKEEASKPSQSPGSSNAEAINVKSEANETLSSEIKSENVESSHAPCCSTTASNSAKRKGGAVEEEGNETPVSKKKKTEDVCRSSTGDSAQKQEAEASQCFLEALQQRVIHQPECATFWCEGWRSKLCRCSHCMEMYEDRNLEFLIDNEDTMQAYEEKGVEAQRNAAADEEADAAVFSSMGRVQQIEVVQGVMDLKSELNDFLKSFAEEGKVVKESDVREFFERMHQRRQSRMHLPQHNCR